MSVALDPGSISVADMLKEVRMQRAAPGGGSVSCFAVAFGAALLEKAARQSDADFDEADGAIAQAAAMRRRALRLAREDAEAFEVADRALKDPAGDDQETRDFGLARALDQAASVPLAIADAAADAVDLGVHVMSLAGEDRKADVVVALLLGEAACLAATHLVEVNLATTAGDERLLEARAAVERASEARTRVVSMGVTG